MEPILTLLSVEQESPFRLISYPILNVKVFVAANFNLNISHNTKNRGEMIGTFSLNHKEESLVTKGVTLSREKKKEKERETKTSERYRR